jgi:hypothetical protein
MKKKETRYGHNQVSDNNNGNHDRENYEAKDMVFAATSKNEKFKDDIWICDSGAYGHYRNSSKVRFNVDDIKQNITDVNGKSITATKIRRLKCQVIHLFDSGLEVKLLLKLWVDLFRT